MDLDVIDAAATKLREIPQFHKLYFKSMVSVQIVAKSKRPITFTRFEVIICDHKDDLVFRTNAPLHDHYMTSMEAEFLALMRGLAQATRLGIDHISIFCRPRHPIFKYLSGRLVPRGKNIALLMDDVKLIRKRFMSSNSVLMSENYARFVYKLATESMVNQAEEAKKETCGVCFDDVDPADVMFSVCECDHQFCSTCVKQHIEAKLLDGMIPTCPQHRCWSQLSIIRCGKLLSPKLSLIWKQMIIEDTIPVRHRFYCPYQKCSYLMSKTKLSSSAESGRRKCFKCHGDFCIHCKVPWHDNLTCTSYKRLHLQDDNAKLKALANLKGWRQCDNCQHMVERSSGCDHMTCRCGYSFSYKCEAKGNYLTGHKDCISGFQSGLQLDNNNERFDVICVILILIFIGVMVWRHWYANF